MTVEYGPEVTKLFARPKSKIVRGMRAAIRWGCSWVWHPYRMFSCDAQKVRFLRQGKCAGSSICMAMIEGRWELKRSVIPFDRGKDYFTFNVFRDPFDRLVSAYRWLTGPAYAKVATCPFPHYWTFSEFITHVCKHPYANSHWYPQAPACAMSDWTLKFSNLQEDFADLCNKMGWSLNLPHYKKQEPTSGDWWTEELSNKVRRAFRDDFIYSVIDPFFQ